MSAEPFRRHGITVDVENIARGLLRLFDEQDRAALAFGMLPEKIFAPFRKNLREKMRTLHVSGEFSEAERISFPYIAKLLDGDRDEFASEMCREIEGRVATAIYRIAAERGQMVV